jgi:glycosyltransferase involved in cell wall biosynthesis
VTKTVLVMPTWYPTAREPLAGPFTRDHTRAAAAFGHRMNVFVDEGASRAVRGLYELVEEQDGELRVFRFTYRPGFGRVVYLPALLRLARRLRIDLIHAHIHKMAWPAALLAGVIRRPFVVTENSSEWPRRLLTAGALRRARIAFARAALVCPVNERLKGAIESYGVRARFRVVPNTVDTSVFYPGPREPGEPARLVNVALHLPVKGLDVLLRAVADVAGSRAQVTLELIGDGPETLALERLADELGIGERVLFRGRATAGKIAEALRAADVFVLSSLSENMPLALLEALCCGLPAAATDVGGVPEALGNDGALAPAGDSAALARAIEAVLVGYKRFDREAIAARAAARYSFEAVGATWDEVYRQIAT